MVKRRSYQSIEAAKTRDNSWLDRSAFADGPLEDCSVNAGHTIKSEVVAIYRFCAAQMDCLLYAFESEPPKLGLPTTPARLLAKEKNHPEAAAEYVRDDSDDFFDSRPGLQRPAWLRGS